MSDTDRACQELIGWLTCEQFVAFCERFMLHAKDCPYVEDPKAKCICGAPT